MSSILQGDPRETDVFPLSRTQLMGWEMAYGTCIPKPIQRFFVSIVPLWIRRVYIYKVVNLWLKRYGFSGVTSASNIMMRYAAITSFLLGFPKIEPESTRLLHYVHYTV
ncbi:hypothetical protein AVEN_160661-1 [Araneus ventricosus]|uniref:Uncharacterized protein n=1 Tax=Araneus ventricosus TaxID=182803 RepID=A0A4Y2TBX9_ARAVE|nr:hypothetical protein AVEN_160661-1 [Araneus ventricosus]